MRSAVMTLACVVSLFSAASHLSHAATLTSTRLEQPVTIDGDSADWKGIPVKIYKREGFGLAVANDEQYLYVSARFKEPEWLLALAYNGVTLWPSAKGEKKRAVGLRYRFRLPKEQLKVHWDKMKAMIDNPDGDPDAEPPAEPPKLTAERIELIRGDGAQGSPMEIDGSAGPSGSLQYKGGLYTCEFRIPLAVAEDVGFSIPAAPGDRIQLGLAFGISLHKKGSRGRSIDERTNSRDPGNRGRDSVMRGASGMRGARANLGASGIGRPIGHARRPQGVRGLEIWVKIRLS